MVFKLLIYLHKKGKRNIEVRDREIGGGGVIYTYVTSELKWRGGGGCTYIVAIYHQRRAPGFSPSGKGGVYICKRMGNLVAWQAITGRGEGVGG